METIIALVVVAVVWILFVLMWWAPLLLPKFIKKIDVNHVNDHSFQNYAKFYGKVFPSDEQFNYKINKIYDLITKQKVTDINRIAELSACTPQECDIKIRYLKNKRLIGDYYIDTIHMQLLPCSEEDQKLLDKYSPFLYGKHSQIPEIASQIKNPNGLNTADLRKEVLSELCSLDQKGLLNGVKINEVDGVIHYYTIEKRQREEGLETIHCPNCGALNDVDMNSKVRCGYCKTILLGKHLRGE